MSVTVNNSPIQNYDHLDNHIPSTYELIVLETLLRRI